MPPHDMRCGEEAIENDNAIGIGSKEETL